MITLIEFVILFGAIFLGIRYGGMSLGFFGGAGLFILTVVFGVVPTSPPIDVMLIIFAVCLCAACMQVAGGLDILVRIAARIIRSNPKYVAVIAPIVSFFLTFFAGTGNAVYAFLWSMRCPITPKSVRNAPCRQRPSRARSVLRLLRLPLPWLP